MQAKLDRRTMFAALGAGAMTIGLTACRGGAKPARATPTPVPAGVGALPDTVMIIRHAEKPTGSGGPRGVTEDGDKDNESLTVRGWTRAGALAELFAPRAGDGTPAPLRVGLSRPATIFASNPGGDGSKRPQQTVTPLAQALSVSVDTRFTKGQEAELVAALPGTRGPVLISWQHESIGAIVEHLGAVDPAPPKSWPGERFDMVYVFTRRGDGWGFTQVPEILLAGDSPTPIP
ncbi:histidine phosphatase family protein [Nocardia sp. NPDC046473]|uniref:histidine phosphatase family protein n=1 Tax=Nocardia sp. NPDC046473 TaxID=3155733 RepID=UPI0033CF1C67